jgi:hypothetical protein
MLYEAGVVVLEGVSSEPLVVVCCFIPSGKSRLGRDPWPAERWLEIKLVTRSQNTRFNGGLIQLAKRPVSKLTSHVQSLNLRLFYLALDTTPSRVQACAWGIAQKTRR